MIKAIAVDDEPLALEIIENFCSHIELLHYERGFTKTGLAQRFLEKNPVDLIFLDVNMPSMSGMDFYKSLQYKPMLIFTTSYTEYALESYELDSIDFLLKPFTQSRFNKAVQKAIEKFKLVNNVYVHEKLNYLILKADYGLVKIILAEILLIEGLDNYIKIYLHNKKYVIVRITMKSLMEKLPENDFIRVHKSYIISISQIESLRNKTIFIANKQIPIGKSYEEDLIKKIKKQR